MAMPKLSAKYKKGNVIEGCKIVSVEPLQDIQSHLLILQDQKTNTRIVQVLAEDKNNVFNIFVPTFPKASNGVAHILEHTTLCGSEKYPVRDSFFAMTKRSLHSFMNAMTGADFTCYPASSIVKKDYFNLMEVYLDAIFFPNLRRMSFLQEGHRVEFEKTTDKNSPLTYKGVVYNEMKGVMSNPQSVLSYFLNSELFPTSIYGKNSGGDPLVIPTLTYAGLKAFHKEFYHPTNTVFFFYGDIPLEENLKMIQEKVLTRFSKGKRLLPIKREKRFKKPKSVKGTYAFDRKPEADYFSGVSWLTCDNSDPIQVLGLEILVSSLVNYDHSPLKIALVGSGLANDLIDFSIDTDAEEVTVTLGGKGVKRVNVKKIQKIILDVLQDIAKNGIDKEMLEIAFHEIEISTRERKEPYGLSVSMKVLTALQRGHDPKLMLRPDLLIESISKRIQQGGFFETLTKKWFLNNPHRVNFEFTPDIYFQEKENKRIANKLKTIKSKLTEKQKEEIIRDSIQLNEEQTKGDDPKDLDSLPILSLKDIHPKITEYPFKIYKLKDVSLYASEAATNGISYIAFHFSIAHLTNAEKAYLPVLSSLLLAIGTELSDYIKLSKNISRYTDIFGVNLTAMPLRNNAEQLVQNFVVNVSGVYKDADKILEILSEVLLRPSFKNKQKVLEIVSQEEAFFSERINPSGHQFGMIHAGRELSNYGRVNNLWGGVEQLDFLRQYAKRLKRNYVSETDLLLKLMQKIFNRNNLEITISSEAENINAYKKKLQAWVELLPNSKFVPLKLNKIAPKPMFDGLQINTNVAYVVRSIPTVTSKHPDSDALSILAKILGSNYTHVEVREKGGAYGGMVNYNSLTGLFNFVSYRDPNIVSTMDVYDRTIEFILKGGITKQMALEGIFQVFSNVDAPIAPASRAMVSYWRIKQGIAKKDRQASRDRLLSMTLEELIRVAKKYLSKPKLISETVVAGHNKLQTANKELKARKKKSLKIISIK